MPRPAAKSGTRRPRWRRRPDARPEEILDAAMEVFGERGFAATRCEEVARRAGISKGTLYLYFESKEALFKEMVRAKFETGIVSAEEFVRTWQGNSPDLLVALMERYWEKVNRPLHVRLSRLVLSELTNFPELARWYYQTIILRGRRVIESVIVRGITGGEFRAVDPPFAARALQTLCVQLAQFRHCFQQYDPAPLSSEELLRGMTDLYLHGLLATPSQDK
jgi:AcrR family transcriptional regulator